jgi:acyl dehydratase
VSTEGSLLDVPDDVTALIGAEQYEEEGEFPVEQGYIWTSASSVENGNPLFWDDAAAAQITGGPIAMPTMLSVWFRPHHWAPGRTQQKLPLQIHFDLKERLGLPEAIMTENTIVFHEPVRLGDRLRTHQVLRSLSGPKTTKLGTGRFWVIDVVYTNQHDALVGLESYTGFGYNRAASPTPTPLAPSTALDPNAPSTTPAARPSSAESGAEPSPPRQAAEGRPARSAAGGGEASPANTRSSASMIAGASPTGPAATESRIRRKQLSEISKGEGLPALEYDVTATTVVLGALASRDWRPMHHDYRFATERNGVQDIFLNTPNQAAWFERFVTDWTGPLGRLGRMTFRMKGSVFPGDRMRFDATVTGTSIDAVGCGWVELDVRLTVDGDLKTGCAVRVAVPVGDDDNPWTRRGGDWQPDTVDETE